MARPVWEQLIPHNLHQHFFGLNLKDWIDANLGGRVTPPTEAITWLSIFAQAAWALWSWRNNTLFETSFSRPPNPVQYIMLKARECEECLKVESLKPPKQQCFIAWAFPPLGGSSLTLMAAREETQVKQQVGDSFEMKQANG